MTMTVAAIITVLDLTPHPEGGFYRETIRDSGMVNGRSRSKCLTGKPFLRKGICSRSQKMPKRYAHLP